MKSETESVRIDKWLWAVRLFKTRSQAADACRFKIVRMGGQEVKASREVRRGDVLEIKLEDLTKTVRVIGLLDKRVGAKLVPLHMEDLTAPELYATARERREQRRLSPPIAPLIKPSKRDRRMLERFFNPEEDRESAEEESADQD